MVTETPHKIVDDMTPGEASALEKYMSLPSMPLSGPNIIEITSGGMTNRDFLVAATVLAQDGGAVDTALRNAYNGPARPAPGGPKNDAMSNS